MAGNPYYIAPGGDYSRGLEGIGSVIRDIGEQRKLRDEENRLKLEQETSVIEANEALNSGDINRIREVSLKNPKLAESIWTAYGVKSDQDKQETISLNRDILATGNPVETIQKRISNYKALGKDTSLLEGELADAQQNPEAYVNMSTMAFAGLAPDEYEAFAKSKGVKDEGFTLSEGQARYDANGNIVAWRDKTKESKMEDAPQGFRFKPNGSLEPIPGGPADIAQQDRQAKELAAQGKIQEAEQKRMAAEIASIDKAKITRDRANRAIEMINTALGGWNSVSGIGNMLYNTLVPGTSISGIAGSTAKNVMSDSDAANLARVIDTIQANLGFEELKAMKASSPTGGALGSVTERELELLSSTIANLEVGQDPQELLNNLGTVKFYLNKIIPSDTKEPEAKNGVIDWNDLPGG